MYNCLYCALLRGYIFKEEKTNAKEQDFIANSRNCNGAVAYAGGLRCCRQRHGRD